MEERERVLNNPIIANPPKPPHATPNASQNIAQPHDPSSSPPAAAEATSTVSASKYLINNSSFFFPATSSHVFDIDIEMCVVLEVDQLDQLRDIFSRFDMDSDGSLTLLELAALLRSLGIKPSGDQIHVLLANMDANGNGTVEFDELVNAITPAINEDVLINQEQLLEVFRSFDRDGNGYITLAELAGSMAKMGQPLTYKELVEMIDEADTDGDGVISFHEFATVMAKSASDIFGFPVS